MFNPFLPFQFGLIEEFRNKSKRWLVAQTFHRSFEAKHQGKTAILLSHYSDNGLALNHLKAVQNAHDKFGCMIDLENEKHRQKLEEMLNPLSVYMLYTSLVEDNEQVQKRLRLRLKQNVRRYINHNTEWRIAGDSTFNISVKSIFGELYLLMRYGRDQERQVKLEEVERS